MIVVIAVGTGSAAALLIDLALAAAAAAWMLWLYTLHPAWRERQELVSLFLAGLIALMAVMVLRDPYFGIFTWTGYLYVYLLPLGRWRLLAAAAVAVIAATSQNGGLPVHTTAGLVTYAVLVSFNVLAGCGFTWFASISHERDDRRKELVAQLSEANRQLEATLAENAGLHQQLLTQAREAGILDERQRMAREIHDTLAQGLTGIVTQLQAVQQASRAADRGRHLQSAIRLARDSLSEARRSVHELRPQPLETARLSDALAEVARHWSDLHRVPARLTTTGNPQPMRPDVEITLLRAAQEGLANVARHAQATRVGLTLSYMPDQVVLDVRDDGIGFDLGARPVSADGGGFGLTAMRQRVEGLSGTLQVESEPGAGTAISACVPAVPAGPSPAQPGRGAASPVAASPVEASPVEASPVEASPVEARS